MQISKHDAWLFPELRNNGAALYTLFTVGKICRQNVSFELEKPSLFPPSNRSPALFLQFLLLSCIHLTIFHLTSSLPFLPLFQRWVMSVILPCLASLALHVWVYLSPLRFILIAYIFLHLPQFYVHLWRIFRPSPERCAGLHPSILPGVFEPHCVCCCWSWSSLPLGQQ